MPLVTHSLVRVTRKSSHPILLFKVNEDLVWEVPRTPLRELMLAKAWVQNEFFDELNGRSKRGETELGSVGSPKWLMDWRLIFSRNSPDASGRVPIAVDEVVTPDRLIGCGYFIKTWDLASRVSAYLDARGIPASPSEGLGTYYLAAAKTSWKPRDNFQAGGQFFGLDRLGRDYKPFGRSRWEEMWSALRWSKDLQQQIKDRARRGERGSSVWPCAFEDREEWAVQLLLANQRIQ